MAVVAALIALLAVGVADSDPAGAGTRESTTVSPAIEENGDPIGPNARPTTAVRVQPTTRAPESKVPARTTQRPTTVTVAPDTGTPDPTEEHTPEPPVTTRPPAVTTTSG